MKRLLAILAVLTISIFASAGIEKISCTVVDEFLAQNPWYVAADATRQAEYRADFLRGIDGCVDQSESYELNPSVGLWSTNTDQQSDFEIVKEWTVSVVGGGNDFQGVQARYRNFGFRLGEFDDAEFVNTGSGWKKTEDAQSAEFLFFVPMPGGRNCGIADFRQTNQIPVFCNLSAYIGTGGVFREERNFENFANGSVAQNAKNTDFTYSAGIEYIFPFRIMVGVGYQHDADVVVNLGYGFVWANSP